MGVHFSNDLKDSIYDFLEGNLPPFAPLLLRLLGGACCAFIFIKYFNDYDVAPILWVIGGLLCLLPALYSTLLHITDTEKLSDALNSFKGEVHGFGEWVLFILLFILMTAIRTFSWVLNYAILGGIVLIISIIF